MKIDEMLTAMSKLYGSPLEPEVLAIYEGALAGIDPEDIRRALGAHVATSPFMPKPSEIIALVRKATQPARNWAEAWTQLYNHHGHTDDPIGQRALKALGGWNVVGYTDYSRIGYLQTRFQGIYETFADAAPPFTLPSPDRPKLNHEH